MNDADLNQKIDGHSMAVDGHTGPEDHEMPIHSAVHPEQIYLDPTNPPSSRWWFASAAFPMIAGTLGPVASAFSICALVKSWRQYIPPGSNVTEAVFVPDPAWLLVVNAIQLVIAIIANVFLLLNMTKRVRFSIAQPITIVGWYISSICLMSLCATASGPMIKQPEIDYVWSGAFYYGIYSAALYFIVASLMVVTVWGARAGHYKKDFELTMSQRTLMLQTIMFMMYLLIGALIYTKIEGWTYLDAVYWADVTLFTVGYGDFSPTTQLGRGLLVPYAFVGVVSLGLVIGSIRSLMLDRGRRRLDARVLEKKRREIIKHMQRRGKEGILEPIDEESRPGTSTDHTDNGGSGPSTELERRQAEFELMRKIQERANTRRRWTAMGVSSSVWVVLWLVGAKIFQECEDPYQGWSYFDSFYFAFTGLTTIGYGDLTPVSPGGKSFFVFWSLLALPTMTVFIANAGDTVVKEIRDVTLKLGNLTILPGEHGFKKELKHFLGKYSCGILFDDEPITEDVPGFLGAAQPAETDTEEEEEDANKDRVADSGVNDPEGTVAGDSNSGSLRKGSIHSNRNGDGGGNSPTSTQPKKRGTMNSTKTSSSSSTAQHKMRPLKHAVSIARESLPSELPKSRAEYHLILIDEIARVTKHLQQTPPRKYTFEEWAWYLKLMGEDESSAETHRRPEPKLTKHRRGSRKHPAHETDSEQEEADQEPEAKWSWVGHRSPLMDTREEAEWVLDRLVHRLREELQSVVTEQSGAKGVTQVREEEKHKEYLNEDDPKVMGQ